MIKKALLSLFVMLLASLPVLAGDETDAKDYTRMAKILVHLNHYPSDDEKQVLMAIRQETHSDAVRTIATAMINLQHKATSADKARLKQLLEQQDIPEAARILARVLLHLSHKPGAADKSALNAIAH